MASPDLLPLGHLYQQLRIEALSLFPHLATARVAGETELVATDRRLREAARLMGFLLFPV